MIEEIITFRELKDKEQEYSQLYQWCSNKYVYEWFEQRKLSLEEIKKKYKNKLLSKKQDLFIIQYNHKDIGYVQIYPFENEYELLLNNKNIMEFDLFIGEEEYLNKGIGTKIVQLITEMIESKYHANTIILRPFKRNLRAIKCYQKCGYQIIKEYQEKDTVGKEETIVLLRYTK